MPSEGVSRQGEEELLHPLHVDAVQLVTGAEALLEPAGDDGEARPVESLGDGGELGDDVLAVAALLDQSEYVGELALGAFDPD